MKYILLITTVLLSLTTQAIYRDSSTFLRANGGTFSIMLSIKNTDTVYSFMAFEKFPAYPYQSVKKELYYGTLNEVYSFMIDVRNKFATAEHGKRYLIDGMYATYSEQPLITHFIIENCSVQLTLLNKMLVRLKSKCKKTKRQLTYVTRIPYYTGFPLNKASKSAEWNGTVSIDSAATYTHTHGQIMRWLSTCYPYPKEVLQIDDISTGFISITGSMRIQTGSPWNIYEPEQHVRYTMLFFTEKGKITYIIKNIYHVKKVNGFEYPIELDIQNATEGSRKHQDVVNALYINCNNLVMQLNEQIE